MATITSVGSGNWSTAGTWDSGVPVDGDDVIISAGHTVTFNADQSAFTTGVKITITGTLNHALTGGPYTMFLKTGASLVGAGTWNVGTEANPIPFAVKHTITGADGWYVSGASGLTFTCYAAEPTYTYVRLTGAEAIGQTVLEVDTDVTGDIWADGDTVHIADINKGKDVEERTIAVGGIAAGAITITAGLTNPKIEGAYVLLMSRNVKFVGVGNTYFHAFGTDNPMNWTSGEYSSGYRFLASSYSSTISGGTIRNTGGNGCIYTCWNTSVTGGVFSNNMYVILNGSSTLSGGIFAGGNHVFYTGYYFIVNGGLFVGNNNITYGITSITITDGTFIGNTNICNGTPDSNILGGSYIYNGAILAGSSGFINNIDVTDNSYILNRSRAVCVDIPFSVSIADNINYDSLSPASYSESIDHDQVAGAYKAWTKGGVTTKQAVTYPTGFTNSMQTVLESATSEGYWQKELSVGAGQSVNITSYLRKDSSMTYLPRVIMFLKNTTDPFAGGTGLHTFTMTDSVDTWEDDTYTYSNDTSEDVVLVIRTQGKNATGNLFSYLDIEVINVDLTSVIALLNTIDGKADTIDANVDAVLADTGTDGVVVASLATDSITAAALKADAVTEIQNGLALEATLTAIKGAGWTTETLAAIDVLIDAIKAKTDLLDVSSVTVNSAISGTAITILRGDTFECSISGLGSLASYVSLDFTVKANKTQADTEALIRIRLNATGLTDGLLTLNGATPSSADDGSIAITDAAAGDITITLAASCTDDLATGTYAYDVQLIEVGDVSTLTSGKATVIADVTRAVA